MEDDSRLLDVASAFSIPLKVLELGLREAPRLFDACAVFGLLTAICASFYSMTD